MVIFFSFISYSIKIYKSYCKKKCLLGPTKYRSFQACPFLLSKLVPQDAFQGTISAAVSSILLKSILNGGGLQAPVILGVDISNTSWNIDTWTRTYWCPIIYVLNTHWEELLQSVSDFIFSKHCGY